MSGLPGLIDGQVHDGQAMRRSDGGLLSLALMDARNRTLGWLAAFEGLENVDLPAGLVPALWLAGRAGWFQEYWIARHVQRGRGEAADAQGLRLASVESRADAWFERRPSGRRQRWQQTAPDPATLRTYLATTLDTTIDLLDKAAPDDDALHVFRLALWHEDRLGEALAVLAQALGLAPERAAMLAERSLWPTLPSMGRRDPMWLPSQRFMLGSMPGGAVPDGEKWAHEVQVPEFEIDAQPVSWSQFAEFIEDGGYDEPGWWSAAGWAWSRDCARRAPRYVEQVAGGVLAQRLGRLQRLPLGQTVLHVSAHEADAWCRWAGRRLPAEAEWELAAVSASGRGFAWGQALEWVAGGARRYPDAQDGPAALDVLPEPEDAVAGLRTLRGASLWGSQRLRHPRARRFVAAEEDAQFVGFRSCAL
jgi:iron(II)-dependent oxidoreductase